jgi:hypothetical protein
MRPTSVFCVVSMAATGVLLVVMGNVGTGTAVLAATAVMYRAFKGPDR